MPNALGLLADPRGEMRATPRNKLMGLLADALTAANDYAQRPDPTMPMGKANPVLGLLADAASLNSLATTAQRASYGEPLTNGLRGSKAFLKPETADALMMAPISPRNALAALGMVGGMADTGAMRAATVWHGSPHKFDRFDASKIGTGEGAQAYGHGLYLAEAPATAQTYATANRGRGAATDGLLDALSPSIQIDAMKVLNMKDSPIRDAMLDDLIQRSPKDAAMLQSIKTEKAGNLYKVDLPDEAIAKMLDWDRSLSEQPQAMKAAKELYETLPELYPSVGNVLATPQLFSGQHLYQALVNHEPPATASRTLKAAGVPGIRYLDGGSRGAKGGTSNFVVFDDRLPSILERNGQPLR